MNRLTALALASLLALPLAATAQAQTRSQDTRPQAEMGRRGGRDMIGRLIAMRSELQLSDAQVARLTDIQQRYQERNRTSTERLRGARGEGFDRRGPGFNRDSMNALSPEQRQAMRTQREEYMKAHPELREARKQMRENARTMRKEVDGVLTSGQRRQLKEHFAQERHDRGDRGHGAQRDHQS